MELKDSDLNLLKQMIGEPTVTWNRFGVSFRTNRNKEMDILISKGLLNIEKAYITDEESFMYSITDKAKKLLAIIYFKSKEVVL